MFGGCLSVVLGCWLSVVCRNRFTVVFGCGLSSRFCARCSGLLPWLLHFWLSWLLSCGFLRVGFPGWLARGSAGLAGLQFSRRSSYFRWWGQLHSKAGLLGPRAGLCGTGLPRLLLVWAASLGLGLARLPWLSPRVVFWKRNIRTHTCSLAHVGTSIKAAQG